MDTKMPDFAKAYGYTPAEFRALSMADYWRLSAPLADAARIP